MSLSTQRFFEKYAQPLSLELVAGKEGMDKRSLTCPEVHRAGLYLAASIEKYPFKRLLVFGNAEFEYLRSLSVEDAVKRIKALFHKETPALILAHGNRPCEILVGICEEIQLPLFCCPQTTLNCINQISNLLADEFAPIASRHGTFVEVFDIGVLIEGDSSIGKSETALGLIERGHRLISDDIVRIKKDKENQLEGHGVELTRHHMEIRGVGIINVANLYGAFCVRDTKRINLIVRLEAWSEEHFYDRIGVEAKTCKILGVEVPFSLLPVKPGRDVVLLIEAIALNYRLKAMGYHSAEQFKQRLNQKIAHNHLKNRGGV